MMRRRKQRPGDEQLICDESGDDVERSSALFRLAADGRSDLIPVAKAERLHHDPESDVREMAVRSLCAFVRRTQAHEDYILGEIVAQRADDPLTQLSMYETLLKHLVPLDERPSCRFTSTATRT